MCVCVREKEMERETTMPTSYLLSISQNYFLVMGFFMFKYVRERESVCMGVCV